MVGYLTVERGKVLMPTSELVSVPAQAGAPDTLQALADLPHLVCTDENVAFRCSYDVVWCTQYRATVITDEIAIRLHEILADVIAEKSAHLSEIQIAPTYVRLRVEISPRFGVHRLVKAMKSRSAGALRAEFPSLRSRLPSLWTNSDLVTTVGVGTPSSTIRQYVDWQRTRRRSHER